MDKEVTNNQVDLTIIGADMNITGKLFSTDDIRIDGKFFGELHTKGRVVISKKGYAEGKVEGTNIIIIGKAYGEFVAKNNFQMSPGGCFKGSVKTRHVNITESADFDGTCTISSNHNGFNASQPENNFEQEKPLIDPKAPDNEPEPEKQNLAPQQFNNRETENQATKQTDETSTGNKPEMNFLTEKEKKEEEKHQPDKAKKEKEKYHQQPKEENDQPEKAKEDLHKTHQSLLTSKISQIKSL